MTEPLAPCPCAPEGVRHPVGVYAHGRMWQAKCDRCDVRGPVAANSQLATAAWNDKIARAAPAPKPLPDAPGWWWTDTVRRDTVSDAMAIVLVTDRLAIAGDKPQEGRWIGPLTPPPEPSDD